MHILKSNVYEIVIAACNETHFNDEFTGCSKAEVVAYFRLLDHRNESVLPLDVVIEHIDHFQHRVSHFSFLLDFIRYHVKSMALDNAINANKVKQQQQAQREHEAQYQQQGYRQAYQQEHQQAHRQPETQQNYVERPPVVPARQVSQPQQAQSQRSHYSNTAHSTSIDNETNSVPYDEAMFEVPVANVDHSEQPIYGNLSDGEDYGIESDVHHMDMGYREDDDLY